MSASNTKSSPKEGQRIAKLLARAGIASRREIERMIADGRVAIDGKPIDTPATILTSLRGVTVDGDPVQAAAPARLFAYHKPTGLLVTERDPKGRPTIYDRLPKDLPRLVPVGRLDLNTEGLLLLTTDGELKRQLELPATGVERTYRARTYGPVTQAQLEDLMEGVEIEGIRYGSIDANLERRTGTNAWIELTLKEGKNREVRRVLEHLGLKVSRLIRTRYGPFVLGDMAPGDVGEIRQHDVVAFRKSPTRSEIHVSAEARKAAPVVAPAPVEAPRPARPAARPPRPGAKPAGASARSRRPGDARPSRPTAPKLRQEAPTKPGRAARAKAFRDSQEPREGDLVDKPRTPRPPRPGGARKPDGNKPSGGKPGGGKPDTRKPRPPRSRK